MHIAQRQGVKAMIKRDIVARNGVHRHDKICVVRSVTGEARKGTGSRRLSAFRRPLVNDEPGTISWFAIQEEPSRFAIFDTFDDGAGREAHLNGRLAAALMEKAKAGDLFEKNPEIHTGVFVMPSNEVRERQ